MDKANALFSGRAFEYRVNWLRFRHFGPVARHAVSGYVLRCADEESLRSLLAEVPYFMRLDRSAVRFADKD